MKRAAFILGVVCIAFAFALATSESPIRSAEEHARHVGFVVYVVSGFLLGYGWRAIGK